MAELSTTHFRNSLLILLLSIVLQSCNCEDKYYSLNKNAKSLLSFDQNETFKLRNIETRETTTFTVLTNKVEVLEEQRSYSLLPLPSCGTDTFYEQGSYTFEDSNNCYNGAVNVNANSEGGFNFTIRMTGCEGAFSGFFTYNNAKPEDILIGSKIYEDVYLLESEYKKLYYSKEKGILQIFETSGNTYYTIVD